MKIYHPNQHSLNVFLISLKDDVFRTYLLKAKEKETFFPLEFGQQGPTANFHIPEKFCATFWDKNFK